MCTMETSMLNQIIIGATGGASASLIFWLITWLRERITLCREMTQVHSWLNEVTIDPTSTVNWRATHAIASYTNLPEDRIRFLCSYHKNIVRNSEEKEVWGIKGRARQLNDTGIV